MLQLGRVARRRLWRISVAVRCRNESSPSFACGWTLGKERLEHVESVPSRNCIEESWLLKKAFERKYMVLFKTNCEQTQSHWLFLRTKRIHNINRYAENVKDYKKIAQQEKRRRTVEWLGNHYVRKPALDQLGRLYLDWCPEAAASETPLNWAIAVRYVNRGTRRRNCE